MEKDIVKEKIKKHNIKTFYVLSFAWQLGFLIFIPIGGFLILGFWLDKKFDTSPLFLIIGIVLGISVTIYEIFRLLEPLLDRKKNNKSK